ncbi:MAG: hypothetical protein U0232_22760 [Thermomicrobiales bacterium]
METRRAMLRRGLRGAFGGAAAALLAACSSPVRIVFPSPTTTIAAPTTAPAAPPTAVVTSVPPQPRPANPMGAGVNAATPGGTPRIPEGFARARLRIIHAASAFLSLTILLDIAEVATLRYPEASAYVDVLFAALRRGRQPDRRTLRRDRRCAGGRALDRRRRHRCPQSAHHHRHRRPASARPGTCQIRFSRSTQRLGRSTSRPPVARPPPASRPSPPALSAALPAGNSSLRCAHPPASPSATRRCARARRWRPLHRRPSGSAATQTLRLLLYPDAA